jgi:hypothetical protein
MIIALAEKDRCPLYKAWQHLMQTRFHDQKTENRIMARPASCSKFELVDLSTPEPRRDQGLSNISSPPIIDLVTPEPVLVVDLSPPEPGQLMAPVVDLSTPEPEQLVPALSVSARALAMSQFRPPGLQLLTPDLRRCLLNRRPHPRRNLITIGVAYHCITHPERLYRQKWYYVGGTLLLKVVMAGFARFLGREIESLYFWLYGRPLKPDETVSDVCYIYRPFAPVFANHSLYSSAWKKVTLLKSKVDEFNIHYLRR